MANVKVKIFTVQGVEETNNLYLVIKGKEQNPYFLLKTHYADGVEEKDKFENFEEIITTMLYKLLGNQSDKMFVRNARPILENLVKHKNLTAEKVAKRYQNKIEKMYA